MSNLQAALGCAQIERIEELIKRKRDILDLYRNYFKQFPCLSMNPEVQDTINGSWMPTVVFTVESSVTREKIQETFAIENIDARVFFWPLSSLPMFREVKNNFLAYSIPKRAINLPSFHDITIEEMDRVISAILKLIK
jgi:perosamine synthetase